MTITTLQELQDLCANGGTDELGANISGAAVTVPSGITVTLDLKDYTITGVSPSPVFTVNGNLTINGDGGSIEGGGSSSQFDFACGGGADVYGGTLTLNGGSIKNNNAFNGGGVYVEHNGKFYMYGGKITGNFAFSDGGGGVYLENGEINLYGGEISANTGGGGVYISQGTCNLEGCDINGNTNGRGVYVNSGAFTMVDGYIRNNSISGDVGGGLATAPGVTAVLSGGEITNNTADNAGGVYFGSYGYIQASIVIKNNTDSSGNTNNLVIGNTGELYVSNSLYDDADVRVTKRYSITPEKDGTVGVTNNAGFTGYERIKNDAGTLCGVLKSGTTDIIWGDAPEPPVTECKLRGKVNGAWKQSTPYVKVSGVWKKCTAAYGKVGGTWKKGV